MNEQKLKLLQKQMNDERARYEEIRREMLGYHPFKESHEIDRCIKLLTESNAILAEFRSNYNKALREITK